jgi:hypothetical protein
MFVPDHQEFWGNAADTDLKVQAIAKQVKCELADALNSVIIQDISIARQKHAAPTIGWITSWSSLITLTLTIDEKSSLNPGVATNEILPNAVTKFPQGGNVTTPQTFSFGFGGTLSSDATRTDKVTLFYKLKDLIDPKLVSYLKNSSSSSPIGDYSQRSNLSTASAQDQYAGRGCIPVSNYKGDLFVQSDLKLKDWLTAAMLLQWTNESNYGDEPTNPQGVISHDVKFEIVSSGNLTPMWKLVRVSANTSSTPLFSASRDRTQDLLITLGPTQAPQKPGQKPTLSTAAQNSHLASEIGQAVASALKTTP